MTRTECPICGQAFEAECEVDPASVPPMLADILGTTPLGAAEGWNHQRRTRLEQELSRHLAKHTPQEWLPALMQARRLADVMTASGVSSYQSGSRTTAQLIANTCRTEAEQIRLQGDESVMYANDARNRAAGLDRAAEIASELAGMHDVQDGAGA